MDSPSCLAFRGDGRSLATASHDGTIKIWDVASGAEVLTLSGHSLMVSSVAFSPDGRTVLSGGWDETVRSWDAGTGRETRLLRHALEVSR